ncbi:MAG: polyribonucleotide nucleotidyltransferase [Candidatus Paceibacterota bacterium]
MKKKEYVLEINGEKLVAVFSDLADQANGSVLVSLGDTIVLATAVMSGTTKSDLDFFPLTVDYEEKFYAAGRILGGRFIKREGRPSEEAILTSRVVDRTIRPLFDHRLRREVQIIITVLSFDQQNDPDIPAIIAASLALGTSDIPWNGPVGAIRIGRKKADKNLLVNPTYNQLADKEFDLLVCGRDNLVNMIEAEAEESSEETMAEALRKALEQLTLVETWQKKIITEQGRSKAKIDLPTGPADLPELFAKKISPGLAQAVFADTGQKIKDLNQDWLTLFKEKYPDESVGPAIELFEKEVNDLLHQEAIKNSRRADGRKLDEVRPLYAEAGGFSHSVHGTGIFYRGGTHVLTTLTLSGPKDSQLIEGMETQGEKFFMHHYNFPPFSVGETGRLGGMSRRSIGHGALAEKSLRAVLPKRETFPYTIRLVSEIMASNGSSSMGSVCGSSLALMDGGVPISRPVAGIAMGLMIDEKENYKILTDIQGPEDHYGDMDLKVAGTGEGITGLQLDIKVGGIPLPILLEALTGAKQARTEILSVIQKAISAPRIKLKESAPQISLMKIPVNKIGTIIGPGGKMIQQITLETGAEISIEDDGSVYLTGKGESVNRATEIIADLVREYKSGDKLTGEVTRLMDFGAFVKIGRDTEGLVHVSEFAPFRVDQVADFVKVGDQVPIYVKERDDKGRLSLSIKRADENFFKNK